jgi:raffinose/stachyose/melibiose transport system permease protein
MPHYYNYNEKNFQEEHIHSMKKINMNKTGIKTSKKTSGRVLIYVLLVIFAFIQLYPFIWLLFFSFKSSIEIYGGNVAGFPEKLRWENYKTAIYNGKVILFLYNSVFVTAFTIFLTLLVSAPAAYAIARIRWKLSNFVLIIFLLGMMIPVHATLLPLFLVFSKTKLLNTPWCLILPYTAFSMPIAIFILNGFYRTIPKEMEESAFLDGCSVFHAFARIILPLIKPALATIAILTYLFAWNELMFAITFISDIAYRTLTVGIQSMVGQYNTDWGAIGAGLVVSTIPTIFLYSLISRQVQNSLAHQGSVKG